MQTLSKSSLKSVNNATSSNNAMDKGQIVEAGTHEELLAREDGYYRYLYRLQNG